MLQFYETIAELAVYVQAVDTRPFILLPRDLGMRLTRYNYNNQEHKITSIKSEKNSFNHLSFTLADHTLHIYGLFLSQS